MTSWRRAIGYGVLVWLVPFVVAFAAVGLKDSWRSLFESIMAVTVAAVVVPLALWYFRRVPQPTAREGVLLGLVWLAISVLIDLPLMLSPPISYSPQEYVADVGVTYLMIPVITGGIGGAATTQKPG
jgi:hypothetical protein